MSTVAHQAAVENALSNGDSPAYPIETEAQFAPGWTKREDLAHGFLGCLLGSGRSEPVMFLAREAVTYADALLIALEEGK